ncbi:MAG: non-canonical purine NTP pyrophosphatase, RdgB/HAM1 family [Acidimicrobiaceae bacterium]|jgi:XTP/dITP diphosphohydrolase|nr:non-canonical purine NTP pyrophosphatase, RdgB/HAM1 family [Acidimicrobiaceae bacterium]|tara:strand:+ start:58633 stop:59217 length:585 start_codon:yes stop_codon:yes gene_type:complete
MKLVSATANPHKYKEMVQILSGKVELLPRPSVIPEIVEDAPDLQGNALLKAKAIMRATGMPAIADDTGLEVEFLDDRPGVHSARYAGMDAEPSDNIEKLLKELSEVPLEKRGARFRTVIVVLWPDEKLITSEGIVTGRIALAPSGHLGFGYDPIFLPCEMEGKTFGEISDSKKNTISHRGRALNAIASMLSVIA